MVQNASWEWLLQGFKIDLETQVKPKTVKDYCDHVSYFARWVQGNNKSDVDLDRQRVLVRKTKTGEPRLAGFSPQTKKALWRYLGLRGDRFGHDALWVTEEGHPLTKHGVQEIMRRLKHDAGLTHLRGSIHKLRHTGATVTLKHTRDMKGLRLLLGHSTLAMTERYTQFI